MKDCIECGAVSPTNAKNCAQCGKEFSDQQSRRRPDGSNLKFYGATAFIVGIMSIITAYWYPAAGGSYDSADPSRILFKADLLLIGGALVQIGAIGWLVGHVVEAISFLPRKNEE